MTLRTRYTVYVTISPDKIPTLRISGFFNNSVEAIQNALSKLDKVEALRVKKIDVTSQEYDIEV